MAHAGYSTSFKKAVATLQNNPYPEQTALRHGAVYHANRIDLTYFGRSYEIELPEYVFLPDDLSLGEKILILHYLLSDGPREEHPATATFEGLRGGMFYFETFKKRGPARVRNDFKDKPLILREIAAASGWREGNTGDISIIIPALPLIEITVVMYTADEEFPAEVTFLFRKDIVSLLPLEDIAALGGFAATRLAILKDKFIKGRL